VIPMRTAWSGLGIVTRMLFVDAFELFDWEDT